MKMRHSFLVYIILLISVLISYVYCSTTYLDPEEQIVRRVIKECTESRQQITCFSNKASVALERAMNWNISLFDGIEFTRNQEKIRNLSDARSLSGFNRFTTTLMQFLDTHKLSLDLTKDNYESGRGGGGGGGGDAITSGFGNRKQLKKERKYMHYAFMVLLGIFGLTGPLVMKTLAITAAMALISSKIALIIVGSVALKKIFEKDHDQQPTVKVHTIHSEDDHDRVYNNPLAYSGYENYIKPT